MTLHLFPNLLHEESDGALFLPPIVLQCLQEVQGVIAESEKEARRYLKRFLPHFRQIPIQLLNEHTQEIAPLLTPLLKGEIWGLISDAGLPCIADPGAALVATAREKGIHIEAHAGPSAIILALMLSGLPAQAFAFHGYLPREEAALKAQLKTLETQNATHLFIEAPYRSQKLLEILVATLHNKTQLCIASDLMGPKQFVATKTIAKWKESALPNIHKQPTVFLFR
jgi:16S rRNA (cytidine1402-2'-O)-methyltransferase